MKAKRKSKGIPRHNELLLVSVVFGIVGLAAYIAVYALLGGPGEASLLDTGGCLGAEPYAEERIEQRANLRFPPSMENLSAESVAWQDCIVYVSFEMAASDLDAFLASTDVAELVPAQRVHVNKFAAMATGPLLDWTFDVEGNYRYGAGQGESNLQYQEILVEESDAETYRVYVVTLLM